MTTEQRIEPRRAVLKAAIVWCGPNAHRSGCVVTDLSATGCRIEHDDPAALPQSFELSFGGDAIIERCEVMWREGGLIGVRFARES